MSDLFDGTEVEYRPSPAESERLGVSVARLSVPFASDPGRALDVVRDLVATAADDVVIIRYPAERVTWFAELMDRGRDLVHADSIVHSERRLEDRPALPAGWPHPDLELVDGRELDPVALEALVLEIFAGYHNHYLANPLFDLQTVLAGYQDWVRSGLRRERLVCVADRQRHAQGFMMFRIDRPRAELLLGGVAEAARGQKAFQALLVAPAILAHKAGCASITTSTQVQNASSQRGFVRAGYLPFAGVTTVHAVRRGLLSPRRG